MADTGLTKLLVVDDEVQITKSLSRLLRKEYQVIAFNNPLEALVYLGENEVAIIMSDMRMPGMGGARFLSESVLIQPHAIRIAFSGGVDYRTLVSAFLLYSSDAAAQYTCFLLFFPPFVHPPILSLPYSSLSLSHFFLLPPPPLYPPLPPLPPLVSPSLPPSSSPSPP